MTEEEREEILQDIGILECNILWDPDARINDVPVSDEQRIAHFAYRLQETFAKRRISVDEAFRLIGEHMLHDLRRIHELYGMTQRLRSGLRGMAFGKGQVVKELDALRDGIAQLFNVNLGDRR